MRGDLGIHEMQWIIIKLFLLTLHFWLQSFASGRWMVRAYCTGSPAMAWIPLQSFTTVAGTEPSSICLVWCPPPKHSFGRRHKSSTMLRYRMIVFQLKLHLLRNIWLVCPWTKIHYLFVSHESFHNSFFCISWSPCYLYVYLIIKSLILIMWQHISQFCEMLCEKYVFLSFPHKTPHPFSLLYKVDWKFLTTIFIFTLIIQFT